MSMIDNQEKIQQIIPKELYQNIATYFDVIHLDTNKENLINLLIFLRDDDRCAFTILTDIFGVDYLERKTRFEVVYNLLSLKKNLRIIIKLPLNDQESAISVVSIFANSVWLEREVWDMYGIDFKNSPDLRRILTDYQFEGHPLRKDFPLTGYKQVKYDDVLKKVVYEPVPDEQQYRDFDYLSPWEGPEYAMEANKKDNK